MKKKVFCLVILVVLAAFALIPSAAFANSAPVKRENGSLDLFAVYDKDISVKKEKLTFCCSKEQAQNDEMGVSVRYEFVNGGEDKTLTLAFPYFIGRYGDTATKMTIPEVSVNGAAVGKEFAFSYRLAYDEDLDDLTIEEILRHVNADSAPVDIAVTRYEIKGNGSSRFYLHSSDERQITLFFGATYDYDSFIMSDETAVVYSNAELYIPSQNCEVVSQTETKIDAVLVNLAETEELPVSYLRSVFRDYYDKVSSYNDVILCKKDLTGSRYTTMLSLMSFDMNFARGDNVLEISYTAPVSCNPHYNPDLYSHTYLSNPAKNWTSFGEFECEIVTDMYLVSQSDGCSFVKTDGGYAFTRRGLPEDNIEFDLSESKRPKRNNGWLWVFVFLFGGGVLIFFLIVGVIVAVIILIVVLTRRNRPKETVKRKYRVKTPEDDEPKDT